ncbi:hypothetical protein ACIPY5_19930 [Microbacterium sp. NPDC089698]|uniref:hypothetical protein n=1 Tax=Microbacterium sp. NPDC089698 TaxID=3364200 RepID=UPI00380CD568
MYQEDPRASFKAEIPDEIRHRAETPERDVARAIAEADVAAAGADLLTSGRRPALQRVAAVLAGAALVAGGVVLGAVAGLLIVGVVLIVLAANNPTRDA